MRSALIALALLVTPALAQEPSEEVKRAALMRAYEVYGTAVQWGMADVSPAPAPVLAQAIEPAPTPRPKPDVCQRHGMRKVTRGHSWHCRR